MANTTPSDDIALPLGPMLVFGLGILVLIIGGLLGEIVITSDNPDEGLADAASWMGWIGSTLIGVALVMGGLIAASARGGYRVAMVIAGVYVLMTAASTTGAFASLGSLFNF